MVGGNPSGRKGPIQLKIGSSEAFRHRRRLQDTCVRVPSPWVRSRLLPHLQHVLAPRIQRLDVEDD
eukprot:scaffold491623_cov39-Prasinocladus_malaysianus.AAC.2